MILDDIVARKKERLTELRKRSVRTELEKAVVSASEPRDLFAALKYCQKPAVIAEIKKSSPSAGQIRSELEIGKIVTGYERAGAAAISVVTEEDFFEGRLDYVEEARAAVSIPILCKDFVIDPLQVLTARAAGADGILLIAAILPQSTLKKLLTMASQLAMTCLVEVHNEKELSRVLETEARLIGINNRDLRTFRVSLGITHKLRPKVPSNRVVVSESGIHTRSDLQYLAAVGVDAVLVGTSLMRAEDPGTKLKELLARD